MKKNLLILLLTSALTAGLLVGCSGEKKQESAASPSEVTEEAPEENPSGNMVNPMVEVTDSDEFEKQLGISIDTECLPQNDLKMFVIGNTLADTRFNVTDIDGNAVACCFRATKDAESAKNPIEMIAGIYATDFSEPVSIDYPAKDGNIIVKTYRSDAESIDITVFDYNDIHYTLSFNSDGMSQMETAALYDSIMNSIGAEVVEVTIWPMTENIDSDDLPDGIFSADIMNIKTDETGTYADFTLYTMDLYDAVDMNMLEAGNTICINYGSDEITELKVEEVEHRSVDYNGEKRDVVIINKGIDEGGAEFIASEGGAYRFFGYDDYATYTKHGTVNIKISDDAQINDSSDIWMEGADPEGVTISTADLQTLTQNDTDESRTFTSLNTNVRIENKVVVEITKSYTP